MSLPSGYTRLEYIESTGTQYIDTGLSSPKGCLVKTKISYTSLSDGFSVIFGSHDETSPYYRNYFAAKSSAWEIGAYGMEDFGSPVANMIYEIDVNTKSGEIGCVINGNKYTINQSIAPSTQRSALSNYLFALHYSGGLLPSKMKMWACAIYIDNVLVRDFIPCKNTDGIIGLWDDVNSQFYTNAGTGAFIAGPVIAIAADKSEITKLEYIQSNGTQYIDTGFKPNNNTRVVMDITPVSVDGTHLFGSRSSNAASDYFLFLCTGGHYRDDYASNKLVTTITPSGRVVIDKNKNSITIGGTTFTHTAASFTGAYPIALLASNTGGRVTYFTKAKLYSCQIYDNGILVRDYIAAKLSDGTVGLYDKLSSLLYINAGTGMFEAGSSSLNLPVNIGGTWKDANEVFVNIGEPWKTVEAAFANIGGIWKELG